MPTATTKRKTNPSSLNDREPKTVKDLSIEPTVSEFEYVDLPEPIPVIWRGANNRKTEGSAIATNKKEMVRINHSDGQSDTPISRIVKWGDLEIGASARIEPGGKEGNEFNGQLCKIHKFNLRGYGTHKGQVAVMVQIKGGTFSYLPSELKVGSESGAIEKSDNTIADKPDIASEIEAINSELNETEATFVNAGRATLSLYKLLGEKLTIARNDPKNNRKWGAWIKERGVDENRDRRARRLANPENWSKLEAIAASNGSAVTDFTLTDALNALAEKRLPSAPEESPLDREQVAELFQPWGEFKANSGSNAKFYPFVLERPGGAKCFRSLSQAVDWHSEHCTDSNRLDAPKPESLAPVSGAVPFAPNPERVAQLNQQLAEKVEIAPTETAAKVMPDLSQATFSLNGALVTGIDPTNWGKQNTVVVIEEDGDSLTLDHGAGYVLTDTAKVLEEPERKAHPAGILTKSGNDEQYTPEHIWKAGLECFDVEAFELDPASHAQSLIPCDRIFTKVEDGLQQEWKAKTLWMNHPYSQNQAFIDKFLSEYEKGNIGGALLLTKSDNRTDWYQTLLCQCVAFCLIRGGLKFVNDANTSGSFFGSTVFYFGAEVDRFYHAYGDHGKVCQVLNPEMFGQ